MIVWIAKSERSSELFHLEFAGTIEFFGEVGRKLPGKLYKKQEIVFWQTLPGSQSDFYGNLNNFFERLNVLRLRFNVGRCTHCQHGPTKITTFLTNNYGWVWKKSVRNDTRHLLVEPYKQKKIKLRFNCTRNLRQ